MAVTIVGCLGPGCLPAATVQCVTDLDCDTLSTCDRGHCQRPNAPNVDLRPHRVALSPRADTVVVGSLCCRNRSYGSHDLLLAGGDRQGTPRQSYLAFDLPDLRGRQIVRAQLRLTLNRRQSRGAEAMEILVYPVTRPWAPATTTWHHQPGAQGAPLHRGWTRPQVNRITTIDVTELVRHWATGTVVNHGLLLRPARPTADQTVAWYAQESPWETRRPLLELEIGG